MRLGLRNKTGFHECPQCKSRSVWKADPYGALEETLHRFLRLSPYRCARCDKRFMDSKIPVPGAPPRLIRRWLSRASRLLQRTPLDEALRMYSILGPSLPTPRQDCGSTIGRSQDQSVAADEQGTRSVLAKTAASAPDTWLKRRQNRRAATLRCQKDIPITNRASTSRLASNCLF